MSRRFHWPPGARVFPDMEIAASIEAAAPQAHVRQVLGAPTSSGKLFRAAAGRNREAVRRAVLHCFVEFGQPRTLVMCQLELKAFLLSTGLPDGISVGHFNAIAGLDAFKDVGLLIVIGRTLPNVPEVETYAGAITGLEQQRTAEPEKGARFHDRVSLTLRMADGSGRAVEGYRHPDPLAEAARWQICEAGVLQAIGRARAVNRTVADSVQIDVWRPRAAADSRRGGGLGRGAGRARGRHDGGRDGAGERSRHRGVLAVGLGDRASGRNMAAAAHRYVNPY